MDWFEARNLCNNKDGGSGWRLPDRYELECMCVNKESLPGGYVDLYYWNSKPSDGDDGHFVVKFNDCGEYTTHNYSSNIYAKCVMSDLPTVTAVTSPAICPNTTASLSATLGSGTTTAMTYTWNIGGTVTTTTTNTITTPALTTTTTYTVQVKNANNDTGPVSARGTITVAPNFSNPNPTAATICYNTTATLSPEAASGGIGTISYRWEQSSNSSTWTNADGTSTNAAYTTPALTDTMYYRRIATGASCGASTSTAAMVTVRATNLSAGAISSDSTTIFVGTNPGVTISNSTSASGGNGSITYQWRRSGTSSATLTGSDSTYNIDSDANNYFTVGTYSFNRYAKDGLCDWMAATGTYTLTIKSSISYVTWTGCSGFTMITDSQYEGSGTMNWKEADEYCTRNGMRLPTVDELYCMCENKESLPDGYKSTDYYWSSTYGGSRLHKTVHFNDSCDVIYVYDTSYIPVKCVK
jgi:hypothetical protein